MNKSDPNLVPPREYQDRYTELLQQASLSCLQPHANVLLTQPLPNWTRGR